MILAFVLVGTMYLKLRNVPEPDEVRVEINTPATQAPLSFALSPDGSSLVFVASGDGPQRLWLRRLDKTDAQPLAGTDGADFPFWSSDNRSIGFFANGKLKRIDIAGGPSRVLADAPSGRGGSWGTDNTILFAPSAAGPLFRLNASGGQPSAGTKLAPGDRSHRWPQFLPDGKSFLFYVLGKAEPQGIYIGTTDGAESKRLTAADTSAAYLPPDHIVFLRQTALLVQSFDVFHRTLTGDPVTIADPVGSASDRFTGGLFNGGFSVSVSGRLAYRTGDRGSYQLVWFDRTGKQLGVAGEPDSADLGSPELSPDGRRLAVDRIVQGNRDVWLMDLVRGGWQRFTFDPALDGSPIWSPDGTKLAFYSARKGPNDIYLKASSETASEQPLLETSNGKRSLNWSKDGRFLLYRNDDPKTGFDLMAVPVTGDDRRPIVVAKTPFSEDDGQFSPDGRWVAYQTDESGRNEIVVQSFPNPTLKVPVSTEGGIYPRWRSDGKELYFIAPDLKLMAATVRSSAARLDFDKPVPLFQTSIYLYGGNLKTQYAVSTDGRFLINQPVVDSAPAPITLILNWKPRDSK
jgi:Tol biopolymer transport system component